MDRQRQAALLESASHGFDCIFENDIVGARRIFAGKDDPFHLLGASVIAFIGAALGMETPMIEEASRALASADNTIRTYVKSKKYADPNDLYPRLEWEILNVDTVVLLGLINALSETYMGYLQCLYSLNSAHSKFTKWIIFEQYPHWHIIPIRRRLYKTVFPDDLDAYPLQPNLTHIPSTLSVTSSVSSSTGSSTSTLPTTEHKPVATQQSKGSFSRWNLSSSLVNNVQSHSPKPEGPIHDFIVSGTAIGYGLFSLVASEAHTVSTVRKSFHKNTLSNYSRSVIDFFGCMHDRKLALRALSIAATQQDPHSIFAGISGDEINVVKEYQLLVDNLVKCYPNGALWTLNKAKILCMSHEPKKAIQVLQEGLGPERPLQFRQADGLLAFELAWTLLGQRRYEESANMFIRVKELNTWSHATYYFIVAGCHWSLGNMDECQRLFDAIPGAVDRKIGGKGLPTEVFIKKKVAFYKAKQKRRGQSELRFVETITISPFEETALYMYNFLTLEPHLSATPISSPSSELILNTPNKLALRSLLLGIAHRMTKAYHASRAFFQDAAACESQIVNSTWIGSVVMFELAVPDLKEVEDEECQAHSGPVINVKWQNTFESVTRHLDRAITLATQSTDLSSRLDTRISMLRDEIAAKKDLLGL